MAHWLKEHFPFAALTAVVLPLLLDQPTLAVLAMAAAVGLLPLAYGPDVDDIARQTRERDDA